MKPLPETTCDSFVFGCIICSNVKIVIWCTWDLALHVSSDSSSGKIRAELWNLFHAWKDPLGLPDPSVIIGAGWALEEIL